MEIILKKEQKEETNEIFKFVKALNIKEQEAFRIFIQGFELGKQLSCRQ